MRDRRGTSAAYVVMQRDTEAGSSSERVGHTGKVVSIKWRKVVVRQNKSFVTYAYDATD